MEKKKEENTDCPQGDGDREPALPSEEEINISKGEKLE